MKSEFPSAVPEIPVSNLSEAIAYYQGNLGFSQGHLIEPNYGVTGIEPGGTNH